MKPRQLRIIGGELRGKKLLPIKGHAIRPTADRVREALFNIRAFQLSGQTVLDLYAGTGALGIEALSRGAMFAYFIDSHPEAISVIQKNLQVCRLVARAQAIQWNINADLECLQRVDPRPTLVLMDPPYNRGLVRPTLERLHHSNVLTPGAMVVAEHAVEEPLPENIPKFELVDQRAYGKTLVSFLTYMI
jgi:16S rRNA (guanine966-N2)-methyltransferase